MLTLDDIDSPLLMDSQKSFTGGQFSNAVPIQIGENQCQALVNCEISISGQAQTRRGTALLGTTGEVGGGSRIRGIGFFRTPAGTAYPLAISDTLVKYLNGSSWTTFADGSETFLGGTSDVLFVPGNGLVYMTDGTGNIRKSNGTTMGPLTTDTPPTAVNLLVYHTNRLIASGVSTAPDAIYFSGILDDTLWASLSGGYQIQIAGDGIPITALVPWSQNNIAVFKRNSTWLVSADPLMDVADMPVQQIHAHIGCVAARSAVQVGADIFFLSNDGVRSLQQTIASDNRYELGQPLSFPIQDIMNRINPAAANKAAAIYWKGKYILAIAIDSATENDYLVVYDTLTQSWAGVWLNLEVKCFATRDDSGIEKLMLGLSDDNLAIEYLDYVQEISATDATYTDYNNVPVLLSIVTRGFILGDLFSQKKGLNANVVANRSRGEMVLSVILDEGATRENVFIDFGESSGFSIPFDIPFSIPLIGLQTIPQDLFRYPEFTQIQFQITASTVGRKEIRQITVEAFPEPANYRTPTETGTRIESATELGACCVDGVCSIVTRPECEAQGGLWRGANTTCQTDPCSYTIEIVEGSLDGTFMTLSGGCSIVVDADVTPAPAEDTYCFDDGFPPPDCESPEKLENDASDSSPSLTPDTCTSCTGSFTLSPVLEKVGDDWILTIFHSFATNCDCSGNACGASNSADDEPSYNLGADPSGNHVIDFTGSDSSADYHIEVEITAV